MKRTMFLALMIVVFAFMGVLPSQSGEAVTDFSGKWVVRWLSNDTQNSMSLTQANGKFTGTYTSDNKDLCSVSGEFAPSNSGITLVILCPKWDIQLDGFPTLDGKMIVGKYLAYGSATGGFIMTKE